MTNVPRPLLRAVAISLLSLGGLFSSGIPVTKGQSEAAPVDDGTIKPMVDTTNEEYARARRRFHTKLIKQAPSPQTDPLPEPPAGVTAIDYQSGSLKLKAWINIPTDAGRLRYPAVLFLHGGFSFGPPDWEMTKPFRDAGYVVLVPMLRGENGQPGNFSLFYDEVDDVLAAAKYLRNRSYVDQQRIFVAGHSAGGTLALLAAMASKDFRAAASFSGSPDQVIFAKYGISPESIPFDQTDSREFQMRSPLAYAASFKCPVRIYFGSREPHFRLSSFRTAEIAAQHGLNVVTIQAQGSHFSAVPIEMAESIKFFQSFNRKNLNRK